MEIISRLKTKPPSFFRKVQRIATFIGAIAGAVALFPVPPLWIPYLTSVATAMGGVVFASQLVVSPKDAMNIFLKYGLDKKLGEQGTLFLEDFVRQIENKDESFELSLEDTVKIYQKIVKDGGYNYLDPKSGMWNYKIFNGFTLSNKDIKTIYSGIRTRTIKNANDRN